MSQTDQLLQVLIDQTKDQTRVNEKLADNIGDLATKIELSLAKHDHTDERIEKLEEFQGRAEPVVSISAWWQNALSEFAKKYLAPILIVGALAGAGISLYPTEKPSSQQKTEQVGK